MSWRHDDRFYLNGRKTLPDDKVRRCPDRSCWPESEWERHGFSFEDAGSSVAVRWKLRPSASRRCCQSRTRPRDTRHNNANITKLKHV